MSPLESDTKLMRVVEAQFRGAESLFIIHLEHQGRSEVDFNKRMFRYFARLHEKHALPVYPIVIFSHDSPRRPESDSYRVEFPGWTGKRVSLSGYPAKSPPMAGFCESAQSGCECLDVQNADGCSRASYGKAGVSTIAI